MNIKINLLLYNKEVSEIIDAVVEASRRIQPELYHPDKPSGRRGGGTDSWEFTERPCGHQG